MRSQWFAIGLWLLLSAGVAVADLSETIDHVKPSVVMVGRFNALASPQFALRGTGFAVGDGNLVATNAHVLAQETEQKTPGASETTTELVVHVRRPGGEWQMRRARVLAVDPIHDLALLRFEGAPVPKLTLRDSSAVREGQNVAFIGFPIGGALGFSPVTHRGMVSAITPIVMPSPTARQLNATVIKRAKEGSFKVFQLDATAYPGNSGGPLFDPESGEVLGVVNMVFVKGSKEAVLSHPSGISYAIPVNYLDELIREQR